MQKLFDLKLQATANEHNQDPHRQNAAVPSIQKPSLLEIPNASPGGKSAFQLSYCPHCVEAAFCSVEHLIDGTRKGPDVREIIIH